MYNEAFLQWKEFHDSLVTSAQSYLNACVVLESVLTRPPQSPVETWKLEGVLGLVGMILPSLSHCSNQLRASQSCLARLRNRSTKLAPINVLPTELLSNIFAIVNPSSHLCVQDVVPEYVPPKPTCLDHIMGVCTRWRQVATDTPTLWSHIDLVATGRWTSRFKLRARYRIERAGDLPIELHIQDTSDPSRFELDHEKVAGLVEFLYPYVNQYRSLDVLFQSQKRELFNSIFQFLANRNVPSILDTLTLATQADNKQLFASHHTIPSSDALSNKYDQLLAPVRRLCLQRTYIHWASAVYHDLVDLSIQHLPDTLWPTSQQLTGVFSSCPKLRRVKLSYLGITGGLPTHDPTPTLLNDLEEINLRHLRSSCATVLSLISPGSKPFSASIILDGSAGEAQIVRSFFHNSHVTALFVSDIRSFQTAWVSQTLGALPHLEQLALDTARLAIDPTVSAIETWPKMHSLYMIDGYFTANSVLLVLGANNVNTLSLWRCRVRPPREVNGIETMEELQVALFDR
ncbi:hypothetical protein FRC10_007107, partial [Ceratobasidium sp. 414]